MTGKAAGVVEQARQDQASGDVHECFVPSCKASIPVSFLMCFKHWKMVPKDLQRAVWRHFKDGQQFDHGKISGDYVDAARAAADFVEQKCYAKKAKPTNDQQGGLF